jgi:hypothetical protein
MREVVDDLCNGRILLRDAGLESERLLREVCRDPRAAQTELLQAIVGEHGDTEFGRCHRFTEIDSLERYREHVPLFTYEDLRPAIERMAEGERDVLIAGAPVFFAQTSGTTGKPKLVPYSAASHHEYMPFMLPVFGAIERDWPGAIEGRQVILSRFVEGHTTARIPYGSASGFARHLQEPIPTMMRTPGAVFDEPDVEARYYAMLLYILSQPLVWLSALNPSTLITLLDQLEANAVALADDLEGGTWSRGPSAVSRVMTAARRGIVPAPERAARIRAARAANGRLRPDHVLPELRVVATWRGGNAKHYIAQLRERLPGRDIRAEVSGASEAALLTPIDRETDGGVPAMFSTLFEFMDPESTRDSPVFYDIDELEPNQHYRLVVSNSRGMYRMLTDDIFVVERHEARAPVMHFSHRHGLQSSLTGEKLTEWHVVESMDAAVVTTGLPLLGYQVCPEWGTPPGYVVLLEVRDASDEVLQRFLGAFEAKLCDVNVEYAAKRASRRLAPPSAVVLDEGTLRRWLHEKLAATGRSDAQAKIPPLRRELLELGGERRRVRLA